MKTKLLLALGLFLFMEPLAHARGSKEKLATPGFTDPANAAEPFTVTVGSVSSTKLYTPNQLRDIRKVLIQNMNPNGVGAHITTFPLTSTDYTSSTTTVPASWIIANATASWNILELESNATYYARFEAGTPSGTIRGVQLWNDPTKVQDPNDRSK